MRRCAYHETEAVEAVHDTCCADMFCIASLCVLFESSTDERATYLIRELVLYEFELVYNAAEVAKNICCVKSRAEIDQRWVTKWFKKFHSCCKNRNDQAMLGWFKIMNSEVLLKAIVANPSTSTHRVSNKLSFSQFITFTTNSKASSASNLSFTLTKCHLNTGGKWERWILWSYISLALKESNSRHEQSSNDTSFSKSYWALHIFSF